MKNDINWYQNAIFYEVYVRAYADSNGDGHGDLRGLIQKLDYIKDLGVDCIWMLPIYESPLRDDGYDISDYYTIANVFGSVDDLRELLKKTHDRGMRLIMDLVVNHTSDQHPWFQAARKDRKSPYRDYYVWSDDDRKYQGTRIIFIDTEKSNWTWDGQAGQFYWHRFYASQPDLNFDNPKVQQEILDVMDYWLAMGVDGFRVDAVPYLFEREGTNCENLPETHQYLKRMRQFVDHKYPDCIMLCEANQWPEDVRPYFGEGDEFHMGFHFPLMPRIYMALGKEDVTPLFQILKRTPDIPNNCQWCIFLRNHDELTLEMVTEEERQWMWDFYAAQPGTRLNLGIRRRLAPLLGNNQKKIELAYSLLFTLPGSPIIYYGDEIGMGDNIELFDRNGLRTPMQWDNSPNAGFSHADSSRLYAPVINDERFKPQQVNVEDQRQTPESLYNHIKHMLAVRKQHAGLGSSLLEWIDTGNNAIAAYWRIRGEERFLICNNLSETTLTFKIEMPTALTKGMDLLSGKDIDMPSSHELCLNLASHAFVWLKIN
ncbi:MAG: maltose alpha-D-glucosyltransferase [Anaerolineales bacterium]|nr:maltose alpha-D-glucosyltransferase [Anaerolineales bacterium]